jgi:hypothetical protein
MNQFRITVLFTKPGNLKPQIEEGHAIQWLKEKIHKNKQRSIVDVGIRKAPENTTTAK